MATQPSLRIGDRERDAVAAELQEHFARGRLTIDEFNQRLDAVFAAKTQSDLSRITSDLPHVRPAGAPLPGSRMGTGARLVSAAPQGRMGRDAQPVGWAGPGAAGDWPAPGWSGGEWSQGSWSGRRRPRHGLGALITLLAAIASWLIVTDVITVGLRFPMPGRIGLLLAIFAIIRGVFRRIFRVGRFAGRSSSCRPW